MVGIQPPAGLASPSTACPIQPEPPQLPIPKEPQRTAPPAVGRAVRARVGRSSAETNRI